MTATPVMPIKALCRKDHYPAYHQSGTRQLDEITLIVLHSTESPNTVGSAGGVAAYFQTPESGGSAHIVVDDDSCQRCLPDQTIPWGAPGANQQGFHIEQCGYAAWTKEQWDHHLPTLHRTAYKAAVQCHRYKIPVLFRNESDLAAGRHGITTHHAVSRWQTAIHAPGDHSHTDPGPGYPIYMVVALAQHYHSQL